MTRRGTPRRGEWERNGQYVMTLHPEEDWKRKRRYHLNAYRHVIRELRAPVDMLSIEA